MNENKDYSYVNPSPEPPPGPEPARALTWRDMAAPLLALALSILFWSVFSLERALDGFGPGLGVPVFVGAYFAAVLLMLGSGARWTAGGAGLMAAAIVLSLCCALYAHEGMTVLNCFIILAAAAMATFSLSGQSAHRAFDLRSLPEAVMLSFAALFTRVDQPFKLLRQIKIKKRANVGQLLLTFALTAAMLAVVLALLSSADMVFKSLLPDVKGWLDERLSMTGLWHILRAVGLALFIASGLHYIREAPPHMAKAAAERERQAGPWLLPVAALDVVYIVFCAVQLRYLFGGAEAAAMAGGWAEYARTGFFQLAAVAAINLCLCLMGADAKRFAARGGPALRAASGLMLALTAVILLSAARRMQLYILAFGLSILRILTLWGMLVIAAGLLIAGWKLYRPGFSFFRVFGGFALGTWCLLCLCSPAGMAANYNTNAYLDGRLDSVDVYYLWQLSPDAAPALQRLAEGEGEYAAEARDYLNRLAEAAYRAQGHWSNRKASFWRAG